LALVQLYEATGLSFNFADVGDVVLRLDPDDPYFADKPTVNAYTQTRSLGGASFSALIIYRDKGAIDTQTKHEFGHAVGLTHSPRLDDLMYPSTARTAFDLSDRERVVLRLMYRWRAPGNLPPDREGGVAATGSVRTITMD
jgi:hypothetical protein